MGMGGGAPLDTVVRVGLCEQRPAAREGAWVEGKREEQFTQWKQHVQVS